MLLAGCASSRAPPRWRALDPAPPARFGTGHPHLTSRYVEAAILLVARCPPSQPSGPGRGTPTPPLGMWRRPLTTRRPCLAVATCSLCCTSRRSGSRTGSLSMPSRRPPSCWRGEEVQCAPRAACSQRRGLSGSQPPPSRLPATCNSAGSRLDLSRFSAAPQLAPVAPQPAPCRIPAGPCISASFQPDLGRFSAALQLAPVCISAGTQLHPSRPLYLSKLSAGSRPILSCASAGPSRASAGP